jgi:hypothetical protein
LKWQSNSKKESEQIIKQQVSNNAARPVLISSQPLFLFEINKHSSKYFNNIDG